MPDDNRDIEKNLRTLLRTVEPLGYVLRKLTGTNIRYGLIAGAHVAALTGNREANDVDFIIHDDDMPLLRDTFPFASTKDLGDGIFLYVGRDDVVEFMSHRDIIEDGNVYPYRLTDDAANRLTSYEIDGLTINLADPVETLIMKAILQRGPDQGKRDLEDIAAVLATTNIDKTYLAERLTDANAHEITAAVWAGYLP